MSNDSNTQNNEISSIKGISCFLQENPSTIKFDYSDFKLNETIFSYDQLVNIQTKNKLPNFFLKIILMKDGYENSDNKLHQQSFVLSFRNLDSRDLVKNILFLFMNLSKNKFVEMFDYSIFIKIPVLQDIFESSHLDLNKFIEVLNESKVMGGPKETLIDSLIEEKTKIKLQSLSERINYISQNVINNTKILEVKKIEPKKLEIPEPEILKEKQFEKTYQTKFNKLNYNFESIKIDFETKKSEDVPLNQQKIQFLLNLSKKCYKKLSEEELEKILLDSLKIKRKLDPQIIKRIDPIVFLENKENPNYEIFLKLKHKFEN